MAELNARQKRFVDEYMIDLNATQAAIRAGYSAKTANAHAPRLLANVSIQAEIARKRRLLEVKTEITQGRVLQELAAIAFSDAGDYARVKRLRLPGFEDPITAVDVVKTSKLTASQRAAIAGIKQGRNGVEVKLLDKLRALELIGKHLGMFEVEQETKKDTSLMEALLKAVTGDG